MHISKACFVPQNPSASLQLQTHYRVSRAHGSLANGAGLARCSGYAHDSRKERCLHVHVTRGASNWLVRFRGMRHAASPEKWVREITASLEAELQAHRISIDDAYQRRVARLISTSRQGAGSSYGRETRFHCCAQDPLSSSTHANGRSSRCRCSRQRRL